MFRHLIKINVGTNIKLWGKRGEINLLQFITSYEASDLELVHKEYIKEHKKQAKNVHWTLSNLPKPKNHMMANSCNVYMVQNVFHGMKHYICGLPSASYSIEISYTVNKALYKGVTQSQEIVCRRNLM